MKKFLKLKAFYLFIVIFGLNLNSQTSQADPPVLREAKKAYSQKSYGSALKQFQDYADKYPNDGTPYVYMGYIYESKKDFSKSISMFRKAVDGNLSKSQKSTSLLKLALYYNYYQDWDHALVYSSRYLKVNPNNNEVQKIYERAEANRGKTGSRIPNYSYHSNSNSIEESNSNLKSSKSKTKAEYESILAKNPNDEEARWDLAILFFNEKEYKKAESQMRILVEKFPLKPSYSYKLGVTLTRLDKNLEALEFFQMSRKNLPDDDKTFQYFLNLNEGLALYKLKRFTESETSLLQAYKLNSKEPPLKALVYLYHDSSNWEKCMTSAEKMFKENPDNLESNMYYAICKYESPEKNASSLFSFEKKLRSKNSKLESIPEKYYLGLMKVAREYTNTEKYNEAEIYFKLIEKSFQNDREYQFYRGKSLFYAGMPAKAIPFLIKVDRSSSALYLLAKSYASLGDQLKTEEYIQKAGDIKESYWNLAQEESEFEQLRQNTAFVEFLKNKGKKDSGNPNKNDSNPLQSPSINP
jgi:tetratricopeptide (TPR) repeat protein